MVTNYEMCGIALIPHEMLKKKKEKKIRAPRRSVALTTHDELHLLTTYDALR